VLVPALSLVLAPAAQGIDTDARVEALEARLESLTRRVAALEAVLKDTAPEGTGAPTQSGEPVWELDDYTGNAPFRVLHHSLDRNTGRVDLLLDVTAEIPDLARWEALAAGDAVPLTLAVEPGSDQGSDQGEVPFTLERATHYAPGARVHVGAAIPPQRAATARVLRVSHPGTTP
jgi:hypothetical protein